MRAVTESFKRLPLNVAARINETLISEGYVHTPWDSEAKQAELRKAFVPLVEVSNLERIEELAPTTSRERDSLTTMFTALDNAGMLHQPDKTKQETEAESLVLFVLAFNRNKLPTKIADFRKIRFWEKRSGIYKR